MTPCKECIDFLSDYVDGYLKTEVVNKLETHFSDCPPCLEFLRTFKSTVSLAKELKEEEVPDEVMLKLRNFIHQQMQANSNGEHAAS